MPKRRAPWAAWYPIPGLAGGGITGKARKITYHTTEGSGLPNWHAIRSVPHLTVNPATGQAWQHLDFDRSGYALGSPGAPRSPNMNAGLHIQIEIIGYARLTPTYDDRWYKRLAVWTNWLCDEWGVPARFPFDWTGDAGYGYQGEVRQPWESYQRASGIVGHSNAPSNTHWDPGNLSQARLKNYLGGEKIMALTDKDITTIAARVNKVLGDYDAEGDRRGKDKPPIDGDADAKPERGDLRLREIEKVVRRIERKLDR